MNLTINTLQNNLQEEKKIIAKKTISRTPTIQEDSFIASDNCPCAFQ
jgi:hypothetical protein